MTDKLAVKSVPLTSLTLDPNNARKHGKRNLDAIADSLSKFGQRRPLVVTHDMLVIAGNGTLEAAKRLGWDRIAVTITPQEWDYDTARAYALADNRTAELASWDEAILESAVNELAQAGWDMAGLGFQEVLAAGEVDVIEDEAPEPPTEPTTKPGELRELGEHRLLCGDSTKKTDMKTLMGKDSASAIFTDPPYNVAYVGGTADRLTIDNDDMSQEDFAKFLRAAYDRMFEVAKPGAPVYVCHPDAGASTFRDAFLDAGFLLKQCLIWVKNAFVLGRQDYNWQHEPILYGWKPGAAHPWFGTFNRSTVLDDETPLADMKKADLVQMLEAAREQSTVIREDRPHRSAEHPTMKPVRLVARALQNSTRAQDSVLDPFGGSGSTLIAAEQMGRRSFTMELDPRYCDVIVERWERLTGHKATLVG